MTWNMSLLTSLSDCELERVIQKLRKGGSAHVADDGHDVLVKVKRIDPERVMPKSFMR